ncbi:abnormal spindle-like microcephaly-associated protein homolog [Uranotaenia lowii]|uniref:abnormal spindle-like microcephaly-associated protein homolog n=1 Tax=Uranotaenia lowii TaxID=190385 RepID=UPI002478DAD4|nr:abnormal spindle-like microcephaly-associated protein homolog [Uranotaenia lowii]
MNFLLHRQRTPGSVIPVSEEIKELMYEISREVLREQPRNVIVFLADYLESKLLRRENMAMAQKVVDTVLDTSLDIIELLDDIGLTPDKAEMAVVLIRLAFKKHFNVKTSDESLREAFREAEVMERLIVECGFTDEEAVKVGKLIERSYKTYFLRNVYKEYYGPAVTSDWKDAAKHSLGIYAASGATKDQMDKAAVKIQAVYRGYFTRKRLKQDQAATVIQRAFKKHQGKLIADQILENIVENIVAPEFSGRSEVLDILDTYLEEDMPEDQKKMMDEAATLIQSIYRGKRERDHLMKQTSEEEVLSEEKVKKISLDEADQPEMNEESAAVRIQALARGHLERKKLLQSLNMRLSQQQAE